MMYNNGFHGFPSISDQQPLMLENQPGWDETKGPPKWDQEWWKKLAEMTKSISKHVYRGKHMETYDIMISSFFFKCPHWNVPFLNIDSMIPAFKDQDGARWCWFKTPFNYSWFVKWNMFFVSHSLGNFITLTGRLLFFREVGIPPAGYT